MLGLQECIWIVMDSSSHIICWEINSPAHAAHVSAFGRDVNLLRGIRSPVSLLSLVCLGPDGLRLAAVRPLKRIQPPSRRFRYKVPLACSWMIHAGVWQVPYTSDMVPFRTRVQAFAIQTSSISILTFIVADSWLLQNQMNTANSSTADAWSPRGSGGGFSSASFEDGPAA